VWDPNFFVAKKKQRRDFRGIAYKFLARLFRTFGSSIFLGVAVTFFFPEWPNTAGSNENGLNIDHKDFSGLVLFCVVLVDDVEVWCVLA